MLGWIRRKLGGRKKARAAEMKRMSDLEDARVAAEQEGWRKARQNAQVSMAYARSSRIQPVVTPVYGGSPFDPANILNPLNPLSPVSIWDSQTSSSTSSSPSSPCSPASSYSSESSHSSSSCSSSSDSSSSGGDSGGGGGGGGD